MGLTVYYTLRAAGGLADARAVVHRLHRAAKRLRFTEVEDVEEFGRDGSELDREDPLFWLKVRTSYTLTEGGGRNRYESFEPDHVIAFMCWPGDTEPSCFGLCRYRRPARRLAPWARRAAARVGLFDGWHWSSFCKTQYASSPARGGKRHFLAAHTRLVKLLDFAKSIGVLADASDDSGYWEHRDRQRLGAEIDRWNRVVAAVVGGIGDALGTRAEAPIREFPNFEHLEAEGQRELRRARGGT